MTANGETKGGHAVVSITDECSNACVFCGRANASALSAEAFVASYAAGHRRLTLGGGEPTLVPDALEAAVVAARRAGFVDIGVATNGHALGAMAASLRAWGVTDVHVSIHGPDAASHDYHTDRPGSFEQLWTGVAAAQRAGLRVVATTVLTRSSYRVLSELPVLLRARGIAAWQVSVPFARGRAQDDFDRVYPRLGMALPFALHALELARKMGLPAYVRGAPLCLLGPLAARSIAAGEAADDRAFHARCEGCAARPVCPGADPVYLTRFDGDELRPRTDRPSTADAEPHAALFGGAGALTARREVPSPEPAQRVRLALPMYGRAQRAQREVATREAKTGEALREILPALFEPADEEKEA